MSARWARPWLLISAPVMSLTLVEYFYTKEHVTEAAVSADEVGNVPLREQLRICFTDRYWILLVLFVFIYNPAFCLEDDFFKRYATLTDMPETVRWMGVPISRKYYEGLLDFDPYAEAGKYKRPVLIVHGNADKTVNPSYGERAQAAYENACLEILPGEDHGFSAKGKLAAAKLVYDFFEANRGGQ